MILKVIRFKRAEKAVWEKGLSIESNGDSNNIIIDANGDILKPDNMGCVCWKSEDLIDELCINVGTLLNSK